MQHEPSRKAVNQRGGKLRVADGWVMGAWLIEDVGIAVGVES